MYLKSGAIQFHTWRGDYYSESESPYLHAGAETSRTVTQHTANEHYMKKATISRIYKIYQYIQGIYLLPTRVNLLFSRALTERANLEGVMSGVLVVSAGWQPCHGLYHN